MRSIVAQEPVGFLVRVLRDPWQLPGTVKSDRLLGSALRRPTGERKNNPHPRHLPPSATGEEDAVTYGTPPPVATHDAVEIRTNLASSLRNLRTVSPRRCGSPVRAELPPILSPTQHQPLTNQSLCALRHGRRCRGAMAAMDASSTNVPGSGIVKVKSKHDTVTIAAYKYGSPPKKLLT